MHGQRDDPGGRPVQRRHDLGAGAARLVVPSGQLAHARDPDLLGRRPARGAGVELGRSVDCYVGPAERHDAFVRSRGDQLVLGPREGTFAGLMLDYHGPGQRQKLQKAARRRSRWHRLPYGIPLCIGFVGYLFYLYGF